MEFYEKLQELRKNRGLTQEELAEALFVSRAAISKWESGRGYPSIDSLKDISHFFSVTIDELLSSEKLLSIAEKENAANIRGVCDSLIGIVDLCALLLIVLPLYPNAIDEFVYSVNLSSYTQSTSVNRMLYWGLFLLLVVVGIVKLLFARFELARWNFIITRISLAVSCITVAYLGLAREAYAIIVAFLLLAIKVMLVLRYAKKQ